MMMIAPFTACTADVVELVSDFDAAGSATGKKGSELSRPPGVTTKTEPRDTNGAGLAPPTATAKGTPGKGKRAVFRPFNAASPWNNPIPRGARIASDSAALIADFAQSSVWPYLGVNIETYGIPVYWADQRTPRSRVHVSLLGGEGFETLPAIVPIPAGAAAAPGTDKHICIIDRQARKEWGFWEATQVGPQAWTCSVCATADLSGTGVRLPKAGRATPRLSHGARACGFPLSAGLITVEEVKAGRIEHALVIAYPHIRSHWYMSPASTAQVTTDQALPDRGIPCGGRVQLDPALDLEKLGLSRSGKIVARALQEYGAFVGDFSGAMSLYADASQEAQAAWAEGLLSTADLRDKVDLRRFRVLEFGTLYEDDN